MHHGRREKVLFPESYRDFRLIRTHGRVFAVPPAVDPERVLAAGRLFTHPAVFSGPTLDDVCRRIDAFDAAHLVPETAGRCAGYDIIRLGAAWHAVPVGAAPCDLHAIEDRRRVGVLSAVTREDVEAAARRASSAAPVEFAGWLPIYEFSGNCGKHPQFTHTGDPPPGYRFDSSAPPLPPPPAGPNRLARLRHRVARACRGVMGLLRVPLAFVRPRRGVSLRARVRVIAAMAWLLVTLLRHGCKPLAAARFLQSRHLHSQLLLGGKRDLVFLTSMPYTFGQNPWVIEVEDPTTLFYPLIQNGHTCATDVRESPYFPCVKALLEADHCKAILTHMRSTADMIGALFGSETITRKVVHSPLGVKVPARWQHHDPRPVEEPIDLLFINSWCQVPENFYVRGGLDLLEAFAVLRTRYPNLRLTLRTALPALADHYHRVLESGWVRVINRFLTTDEMADLHAKSHIFLLPAARVHIVSLLQAMSYGLAVVASDGWGIEEYLDHDRNGLVVRGRYGQASWADPEAGQLRENYETMYLPDPVAVRGIVEAVSRLVEDARLRARLGRAARADVETKYNLGRWNEGVKAAFDLARAGTPEQKGERTRVSGPSQPPSGHNELSDAPERRHVTTR